MKNRYFSAFQQITLIGFGLVVIGGSAACAPRQQVVTIPTLVELPTLTDTVPPTVTDTETHTLTPSATPTGTDIPTIAPVQTASPSVPTPTASPSATPTPVPSTAPTVTRTPSATITDTITPSLTPTFTASPEIGAFGALVDLAARVTVLPLETRYNPPTLTALAAARAQLASQTPPGALVVIAAGPGLVQATLPPGAALPTPPVVGGATGQIISPPLISGATPLPPPLICQYPPPGALPTLLAADAALAASLGCPVGAPPAVSLLPGASQVFERGTMIYIAPAMGGSGSIYVLTPDQRFRRFDDTFLPGVDPELVGESVPSGLFEPVRGFGKVWRLNPDVRAGLGYALAPEQGDTTALVEFTRGRAVYVPMRGATYVLIDDAPGASAGSWRALMGGF
jgi:hypothetical protein